jgi:hypothetical protein
MRILTVGDVQALAKIFVEAGFRESEFKLADVCDEWNLLPTEIRAKIAQIHPLAVKLVTGRDYPLAQDEYDYLLKRLARELNVEEKLVAIRDRWNELSGDTQAHLTPNHPFMVSVVEFEMADIYDDPTVEIKRSAASA